MKIAACFLTMTVGFCAVVLADEPPSAAPQTPAAQTPSSPPAAAQSPAVQTPAPGAASSAGDAKAVPSPASGAADLKSAPGSAAEGAPKADKTEVANAGPSDAQIKQMRGRGFKPVMRNGTMVFCRAEGEIGTHFQRTRCNTLEELNQAQLSGKEYLDSIQQQGSAVPFKGP